MDNHTIQPIDKITAFFDRIRIRVPFSSPLACELLVTPKHPKPIIQIVVPTNKTHPRNPHQTVPSTHIEYKLYIKNSQITKNFNKIFHCTFPIRFFCMVVFSTCWI